MTSVRRTMLAGRLVELERRPAPIRAQDCAIPIPSADELAAMTNEELNALCDRVLATVDLTSEESAMTNDELDEYCGRLVKEDELRAGHFN